MAKRTRFFALGGIVALALVGVRIAPTHQAVPKAPVVAAPAASVGVATSLATASTAVEAAAAPVVASATPAPVAALPEAPVATALVTAAAVAQPVTAAAATGTRSRAITRSATSASVVALTFDAGADAGHAAAILDILEANHAVASFGVTGQWAEANPDLVRRMVAGGHQLINHTYNHGSFTGFSTDGRPLTRAQRLASIERTEAIFQTIAGVTAKPYFRPPYGDLDSSVLEDVGSAGYSVTAMWAVDSLGWNGLAPGAITERTLRLASPGAILIFHVGAASADDVALPAILTGLRERGYTFATLSGLLAS